MENNLQFFGEIEKEHMKMVINVNIKQLSKKGRRVKPVPFVYESKPKTVEEFLKATVGIMYENFMKKLETPQETGVLYSEEQIKDMAEVGKIAFGFVYGEEIPDLEKAIDTALLAYKDRIVRLFVGDEEAGELQDEIKLEENGEVSFIRLTMLAGRIW